MTARELALDTFKYYEEDPSRRAMASLVACSYKTDDNKKCAVGRWFDEDKMEKLSISWEYLDSIGIYKDIQDLVDIDPREILKDEVKDIPDSLWIDLQNWHDNESYWNNFQEQDGFCENFRNDEKMRILASIPD